jgi:PAS domain S-box-containing protein
MINISANVKGLSGNRIASAPFSGSHRRRHDADYKATSARGQRILYGIQALWLGIKSPNLDLLKSPEYIALVTAAVIVCLLLAWNFIFRKRLARYRQFSSSQDERYRQFFDNCPDALLVVELDGSIVTANARAAHLFKMEGQDLLAKSFWSFVSGVSKAVFEKQFHGCISGKQMRCEGFIQAFDGTMVPVVLNGSYQPVGEKGLVQLYVRDNSVFREVEDQVRCLYNEVDKVTAEKEEKEKMVAEETRLARKEFITFANHQIRTPLDGIMGMAQLLADTPLNIDQHNCVQTILKSSAGLLNVVRSLSEDPGDAIDVDEPPQPVTAPPVGSIQDALVLLVDDNKISQKVVAALLRKAKYEVDVVENGKEALSRAQMKPYDIILMDCQMPVMDGYEATAGIRAMPEPYRSVPIIALTAHSLKHELQACRDCGMDGHLVKPADHKELIDVVSKYVQKGRQERFPVFKTAS